MIEFFLAPSPSPRLLGLVCHRCIGRCVFHFSANIKSGFVNVGIVHLPSRLLVTFRPLPNLLSLTSSKPSLMPTSANDDGEPRPGHLGKTWELGVVIAVVVVVVLSVATVVFSYHRRQRKRRQLQQQEDILTVEAGRKSSPESADNHRERIGSGASSSKVSRGSQSHIEITQPTPSLTSESRRSSRAQTPSQKPPKYYWTVR
ncbi:hypothetical protein L218DRAFT_989060 [Marasmius fiardii PR-910]|nr:hypothetical protein L218DRAFT_989060 [Marasmius fiardii PR-910]